MRPPGTAVSHARIVELAAAASGAPLEVVRALPGGTHAETLRARLTAWNEALLAEGP